MLENEKKFLDQKGLEYLWSKINMQDYPNNDTLIAVINAIDEGKMDKTTAIPLIEQALVGQVPAVKSVDENGKPISWEAVTLTNIPETSTPDQYLITNAEGEKIWEDKPAPITNEEIDAICNETSVLDVFGNVLVDTITGIAYRIYVEDGKLHMCEVDESTNTTQLIFMDISTGSAYEVYVEDGKLHMMEVE